MKNLSTVMKVHLAILILLMVGTCASMVYILATNSASNFETFFGSFTIGVYLAGIINIAALACGAIYILKGYTKEAAKFYKAFIALMALYTALTIVPAVNQDHMVGVACKVIKLVILLELAFVHNQGAQTSWMLFAVMLVIDLAYYPVFASADGITYYRVVSILSKLAMDVTVGLAIRGKYLDKAARGSK